MNVIAGVVLLCLEGAGGADYHVRERDTGIHASEVTITQQQRQK